MPDADVLLLQLEAVAIASRLRRVGECDHADLVEMWAHSQDLLDQLVAVGG